MEMKVNIPFNQLLQLIRQLSPSQKQKLHKELQADLNNDQQNDFKEFLLKGPVFSEQQIKEIQETRKSINKWRTK
jgi:hypothetical protein